MAVKKVAADLNKNGGQEETKPQLIEQAVQLVAAAMQAHLAVQFQQLQAQVQQHERRDGAENAEVPPIISNGEGATEDGLDSVHGSFAPFRVAMAARLAPYPTSSLSEEKERHREVPASWWPGRYEGLPSFHAGHGVGLSFCLSRFSLPVRHLDATFPLFLLTCRVEQRQNLDAICPSQSSGISSNLQLASLILSTSLSVLILGLFLVDVNISS